MAATNEPTDLDHPHPGTRVDIDELAARKLSAASTSSIASSKRPSTASSNGGGVAQASQHEGEGTWHDLTTSETFSQKPHGVEIRDFASGSRAKDAASGKAKPDIEKSRRMLEKSSLA